MTYAHKTSSTKILVVGGDGLIGKSLVEQLVRKQAGGLEEGNNKEGGK